MYLERLHVIAARLFGGFPGGEAAQRTDVIDAEFNVLAVDGGDIGTESAPILNCGISPRVCSVPRVHRPSRQGS